MGTGTMALLVTLGVSAVFTFMDFFVRPENIRKYKIQLNTNEPPDYRKFTRVICPFCGFITTFMTFFCPHSARRRFC
jgi:hypothetical protein